MAVKKIILSLLPVIMLLCISLWLFLTHRRKRPAILIVLDGVSSVGKSTIARLFMPLNPGKYTLVGIDDFVTPVFMEQEKNPVPFEIFLQRVDESETAMFEKIKKLLAHGKPVILDTVMAGLRGVTSIQRDLNAMKNMNKILILVHRPLPLLIQRITERNKRAQEQGRSQDSRPLVMMLRQVSATYKQRNSDAEADLGYLYKHDLENACLWAKSEFGDDQKAYAQFKDELFNDLTIGGKEKIQITTRIPYDLIIYAERCTPEESAEQIQNFLR